MLANSAEVRDAMLYVLGGSPEWWSVPATGTAVRMAVALVLEAEHGEQGEHRGTVAIRHVGSEEPLFSTELSLTLGPRTDFVAGAPQLVPLALNASVTFAEVGPHLLEVAVDEDSYAVPFGVRVTN